MEPALTYKRYTVCAVLQFSDIRRMIANVYKFQTGVGLASRLFLSVGVFRDTPCKLKINQSIQLSHCLSSVKTKISDINNQVED